MGMREGGTIVECMTMLVVRIEEAIDDFLEEKSKKKE